MLPVILAGGAALFAFLLSGCSHNKRPEAPPSRPLDPPRYPDDLGGDEKAKWLRLQLKLAGVSDPVLDQGCPSYQFTADGIVTKASEGKGDQRISGCEVYEFTLNHYEEHPEWAETLTEKPIPWSLNDRVLDVPGNEEIRKKIDGAFQFLEFLLKKKGIHSGTAEYQEAMAVALFYLTASPDPMRMTKVRERVIQLQKKSDLTADERQELAVSEKNLKRFEEQEAKIDKELERLKVMEVKEFRRDHGFYVRGDYTKEYTALKALQEGVGECTEHSKILFALLKRAGLSPQFVLVDPSRSEDGWLKDWIRENPDYSHICIGLTLNGRFRMLDSALMALDPPHRAFAVLTLRQYLSQDFMNRGTSWEDDGNPEQALKAFDASIRLDRNSFAYLNRGALWDDLASESLRKGDGPMARLYTAKALDDLDEAIRVNPFHARNFDLRGTVRLHLNQWKRAEEDFNAAIRLNPLISDFYFHRALVESSDRRIQDAVQDFISCLKLSPEKGTKKVREFMITVYANQTYPGREIAEEETHLDSSAAQAQVNTASMLWLAGHKNRALEEIQLMVDIVVQQRKELDKEKKSFSPQTVRFLKSLLEIPPPDMKQSPEIQAMKKSLALPEKP